MKKRVLLIGVMGLLILTAAVAVALYRERVNTKPIPCKRDTLKVVDTITRY